MYLLRSRFIEGDIAEMGAFHILSHFQLIVRPGYPIAYPELSQQYPAPRSISPKLRLTVVASFGLQIPDSSEYANGRCVRSELTLLSQRGTASPSRYVCGDQPGT